MKLLRGVGFVRVKYNLGTAPVFLNLATCKEVNLGITAEDVRQNAGDKLFALDIYTHTKSGRIRITDASLNMEVLELMGAGTPSSAENMLVNELLTVATDQVVCNTDYISGTISLLDENGNPILNFTESPPRTITGLSSYNAQKISVYYETDACTNMVVNSLKVFDEPLYFELIHVSKYRDPIDNLIKLFQIRVHRCRLIGNLEYTYSHGEFVVPVIEGEILDPCRGDRKVITYAFGTEPVGLVHV